MAGEPSKQELTREALQKTLEWAETAEGFVADQAPAVAREMVLWGQVFYGVWSAFFGVLFIAFVAGAIAAALWGKRQTLNTDRELSALLTCLMGSVSVLLFVVFLGLSTELLRVMIAPRLYVLEQTTQMLGM